MIWFLQIQLILEAFYWGQNLKQPIVYNIHWTVCNEAHSVIAPSPLSYVPLPVLEISDCMSFLDN